MESPPPHSLIRCRGMPPPNGVADHDTLPLQHHSTSGDPGAVISWGQSQRRCRKDKPMHDLSRSSFLADDGSLSLASLVGNAFAQGKIKPGPDTALVVVDVQNCFLPGGSLAVNKGDEIIPLINKISKSFQNVVLTQDWHTPGHISFASSHPGKKPFESIKLPYGNQILWPDHCVQGTEGAATN